MKYAADFREIARNALRGKWGIAVVTSLIASLLNSAGSDGVGLNVNIEGSHADLNFNIAGQTVFSTGGDPGAGINAFLVGTTIYIVLASLVIAALLLLVGSVVSVGYSKFNLDLVDHQDVELGHLFRYFPHWKNTVCASLLKGIYIFLWSLLLFIPGIIASYSYAMTNYILAEHPELTAREAIALSKDMMEGNRWRLFCLHASFIGWSFLCLFTFGIGNLWLSPYKNAAEAAFYREVSGTELPPLSDTPVWENV